MGQKKMEKIFMMQIKRLSVFAVNEVIKNQNQHTSKYLQSVGEVIINDERYQIQIILEPREHCWVDNKEPTSERVAY
jgi:hypothetical protein